MSKHSPGDWRFNENCIETQDGVAIAILEWLPAFWCEGQECPSPDEQEANGRLIAAAPTMHKALLEFAQTPWGEWQCKAMQRRARAALAAVEGE